MTRRSLLLLLAPVLFLAAPAGGRAADCGGGRVNVTVYETPDVKAYLRLHGLYACHLATDRERGIGVFRPSPSGHGITDISGVLGGRYVWTTDDESDDVTVQSLTDLRTGKRISARATAGVEVVVGPGVLVTNSGGGVTARYTDGRRIKLSTAPDAAALAITGARVYWQSGVQAHTAVLALPAADRARTGPLARTEERCKPRPGARLVLNDNQVLLSRVGRTYWACAGTKTREIGDLTSFQRVSPREVAYARAGFVGRLDIGNGRRTEVPGSAFAANTSHLLAVTPEGVRGPLELLAAGPVSEPALGGGDHGDVAYWLDGAQAPQMRVLEP